MANGQRVERFFWVTLTRGGVGSAGGVGGKPEIEERGRSIDQSITDGHSNPSTTNPTLLIKRLSLREACREMAAHDIRMGSALPSHSYFKFPPWIRGPGDQNVRTIPRLSLPNVITLVTDLAKERSQARY